MAYAHQGSCESQRKRAIKRAEDEQENMLTEALRWQCKEAKTSWVSVIRFAHV